jgi:hypothetical protein
MALARKVLWIWRFDKNEDTYKKHLDAAGVDTVCINTMSHRFPALIDEYKKMKKTVWAWRWPGVRPSEGYGWHYYAPDQGKFVADLVKQGLDGFIVDPESNDNQKPNDWNQTEVDDPNYPGKKIKTGELAKQLWESITKVPMERTSTSVLRPDGISHYHNKSPTFRGMSSSLLVAQFIRKLTGGLWVIMELLRGGKATQLRDANNLYLFGRNGVSP